MSNRQTRPALIQVIQEEGMIGLYKGMVPAVVRLLMLGGFHWSIYQALREAMDIPEVKIR